MPNFDHSHIPDFVLDSSIIESELGSAPPDQRSVPHFLMNLAGTPSGELDPEQEAGLDAICRKLSVHGSVRTSYDLEWKQPAIRKRLAPEWWPLMIFLLLSMPESDTVHDERDLANSMKRLNSAFVAIDLADARGVSSHTLEKLKDLSTERLDALLS